MTLTAEKLVTPPSVPQPVYPMPTDMEIREQVQQMRRGEEFATEAEKRAAKIDFMRWLAKRIAKTDAYRLVSVREIRQVLTNANIGLSAGNWMGSIFKSSEWGSTGQWVQVGHKDGKGRWVRVWRYTGDNF